MKMDTLDKMKTHVYYLRLTKKKWNLSVEKVNIPRNNDVSSNEYIRQIFENTQRAIAVMNSGGMNEME